MASAGKLERGHGRETHTVLERALGTVPPSESIVGPAIVPHRARLAKSGLEDIQADTSGRHFLALSLIVSFRGDVVWIAPRWQCAVLGGRGEGNLKE